MAFVPGFDYDIFISYAHTDNSKRLDTDPKGWIEDLHEVLSQRLARRLGRADSFAIWRDNHLTGYDKVDPVIAEKVRTSALFLCVFSPSYLASSYCCEELRLFREASSEIHHAEIDFVHRILKVKHLPAPGEEPAPLKEVNGYQFFTIDKKNHPRELWRINQNTVNEAYWELAQDLADDIADLLERLKKQGISPVPAPSQRASATISVTGATTGLVPAPSPSSPAAARTVPTVYLAEAPEDLDQVRIKLRRNLKQQGLRILPETPLPNSPKLTGEIDRHLRQAHLGVHLVGAEFGAPAFGDLESRSLAHVQYLRAKELGMQRIVWMAPRLALNTTVPDERQQLFLSFLEEEFDPEGRVDLQRGLGFEAMVEEVVKKAYLAAGMARPKSQQRRRGTPQIDIACQTPDLAEAMDIKKLVYQSKFDVNVSVDDSPKFSTLYQHILKRSDALLILYGKASPVWVAERADQARQAVRKRTQAGKGPFVALVYDGPPLDKGELPFGYQEVAVVTHRDRLARDEIVSTIKSHLGGD